MLVRREIFDGVPLFWSQHIDVQINYVGHAEKWDEIAVDGNIAGRDCVLRYKSGGRVLAVASVYRDLASLQAEGAMERGTARAGAIPPPTGGEGLPARRKSCPRHA